MKTSVAGWLEKRFENSFTSYTKRVYKTGMRDLKEVTVVPVMITVAGYGIESADEALAALEDAMAAAARKLGVVDWGFARSQGKDADQDGYCTPLMRRMDEFSTRVVAVLPGASAAHDALARVTDFLQSTFKHHFKFVGKDPEAEARVLEVQMPYLENDFYRLMDGGVAGAVSPQEESQLGLGL